MILRVSVAYLGADPPPLPLPPASSQRMQELLGGGSQGGAFYNKGDVLVDGEASFTENKGLVSTVGTDSVQTHTSTRHGW